LEEERAKLESQMRTAEGRQQNTQLIASLALVAALGAGAWYLFSRRRRDAE
jgi:LPXTG-motif cell wall-anchored protein